MMHSAELNDYRRRQADWHQSIASDYHYEITPTGQRVKVVCLNRPIDWQTKRHQFPIPLTGPVPAPYPFDVLPPPPLVKSNQWYENDGYRSAPQ
jgi:hypothetical protein